MESAKVRGDTGLKTSTQEMNGMCGVNKKTCFDSRPGMYASRPINIISNTFLGIDNEAFVACESFTTEIPCEEDSQRDASDQNNADKQASS